MMSDDKKHRLQTISIEEPGSLNATQIYSFIKRFTDIQTQNAVMLADLLFARREEVINGTTPVIRGPSLSPTNYSG